MARHRRSKHSSGWELRQRTEGGVWLVRFWLAAQGAIERSTRTSDLTLAKQRAAEIYAHWVSREPAHRPKARGGGALDVAIAQWLVSIESTHAEGTRKIWAGYARAHWMPRWFDTSELTAEAMLAYRDSRLKKVVAETVKRENTALRSFLRYLAIDVPVPSIGKRTIGTPHPDRHRKEAPDGLTDELMESLLAELPEWSTSRKVDLFPIRARFVVGYYTSLRPSTLDKLRMRRHFETGSTTLIIEDRIDKARFGRELPLADEARLALESVCRVLLEREAEAEEPEKQPLIFGKHDYREHIAEAAKVLPKHMASRFCAAHLRSARITHALEVTGNVPGAQFLAGHKTLAATTRYVKPTMRAAMAMLADLAEQKKAPRPKVAKKKTRAA